MCVCTLVSIISLFINYPPLPTSILMYECKSPPTGRYDVVDIDPYGSPTLFLDSAVQACHDGGIYS